MGEKRVSLDTLAPALNAELGRGLETPALSGRHKDWELLQVPIEVIIPNPDQPRREFNEVSIRELAQSIDEKGLMEPLVVRPLANGTFELIAGERRLRALRLLGRAKAPVVVNNTKDPLLLALIENIQREDLNPVDLAGALQRLKVMHDMRDEDLAKVLGKSRSWITETLVINKLAPEEKKRASEANLNRSALIEMARGAKPVAPLEGQVMKSTVRDLRAQRKDGEPPKTARFHYRSEEHHFNLTLVFEKPKVNRDQIKAALREFLTSLDKKA